MKFTLAKASDWQGLYCDNYLILEDYEIRPLDLFIYLDYDGELNDIDIILIDEEWFNEIGRTLPDNLNEIKVQIND